MTPKFIKQFFAQPNPVSGPRPVCRGEWERIINQVVAELGAGRNEWFSFCVSLLKDRPTARANPGFSEQAEIATRVFQSIDALEAVAAKRYIEPADGRDFANPFFAAITEGSNVLLTIQLHKELRNARNRDDQGGHIFILCGYVAEAIVMGTDAVAMLGISSTIPPFTNLNQSVVAAAFGDGKAVQELEQKRDRC